MTSTVASTAGIIDPEQLIIDTHQHLFLRTARRYLADEFATDMASGHRIVASVYVEAGGFIGSGGFWRPDGPKQLRPLGEVEFANGVGAMGQGGYFDGRLPCAAVIGHADLAQGDIIAELLDRCLACAPERFRGIRQPALYHESPAAPPGLASRPPRGLLGSDAFRAGFAHLGPRDLSFDVAVYHTQFDQVAALADAFPDTRLILNHMGTIYGQGLDVEARAALRQQWLAGLIEVAKRPNVYCKISGLGMPLWGFGFDTAQPRATVPELAAAWKPLVESAIHVFGPERCMAGSNFPVDSASASYADLWSALKLIVADLPREQRDAIFHGTAVSVYRMDLPVGVV